MTYTSHGHHIPGTVKPDGPEPVVSRCGAFGICPVCSREARNYAYFNKEPGMISKKPLRYRTTPVEVQAMQFAISNGKEVAFWCNGRFFEDNDDRAAHILIPQLDGPPTELNLTNYVVKHEDGRVEIVEADAFEEQFKPHQHRTRNKDGKDD